MTASLVIISTSGFSAGFAHNSLQPQDPFVFIDLMS